MNEILIQLGENLQKGRAKVVGELVTQALADGIDANEILQSLLSGMDIVAEKFKNNEVYVPEVLIAARAMNTGTQLLKPHLDNAASTIGKAIVGTVKGDLHDIGKNLVRMMFEGKGIEVIDLGTNVSAEAFVDAVREHKPQVLALSALLTTTMGEMATIVQALKTAELRDEVFVMVGGAPVTEHFCQEIGADAYAADAANAADMAKAAILGK